MTIRGTDIHGTDATLLAFWLGLPAALRYLLVIATILGAGWTARGTFSEYAGLGGRVSTLEADVRALRQETTVSNARVEAIMLYLVCRSAEIDAGRQAQPCTHYVRAYPDIYSMLTNRVSVNQ